MNHAGGTDEPAAISGTSHVGDALVGHV